VKKQAGKVMLRVYWNKDSDKSAAALRRANAVRDGLIARGVSPDRVEAVAAGRERSLSRAARR
jgi:outer membrane protein OmpA-like peptidoglycan-associated protein